MSSAIRNNIIYVCAHYYTYIHARAITVHSILPTGILAKNLRGVSTKTYRGLKLFDTLLAEDDFLYNG